MFDAQRFPPFAGENSRFSVGSASGHAALHPRPPGFHGDPGGGTTATGTSAEGPGERRWKGKGDFHGFSLRIVGDFMRISLWEILS